MDGSGGAKFKKSILPHVILRELHSDIELMLTNCRRSEKNVRSGSDKEDSDKLVDVESSDNVVNVGNVGDLVNKGTGWSFSGTEIISGSLFKVYAQGGATLKLQQATDITLRQNPANFTYTFNADNPAGFTGDFSIVGVQGYQGLGPAENAFDLKFLRSSGTATLTLSNLPVHDQIDIGFLLAIIDSV